MNKERNNKRFGGALGIIIGIIVAIAIIAGISVGYIYNSGKEQQNIQNQLWSEAFSLFNKQEPEAAYSKLVEARATFCDSLDFYREFVKKDNYLTKSDVNEAIVLICQSEAYDKIFNLQTATDWIQRSKTEVTNIEDPETKTELTNFILRAEAANNFCIRYKECTEAQNLVVEKYQTLVKDSLKVANQALDASDYDYTTFEIRFLIACGKSFNEPILVSEARKQLFDLTHIFGEDEKTKLLWRLLRK